MGKIGDFSVSLPFPSLSASLSYAQLVRHSGCLGRKEDWCLSAGRTRHESLASFTVSIEGTHTLPSHASTPPLSVTGVYLIMQGGPVPHRHQVWGVV